LVWPVWALSLLEEQADRAEERDTVNRMDRKSEGR
jgi:hypothetical protein